MGNGSVFQLLPQRFPTSVGMLTGIVGAAGGLGGFFLPSILGLLKDRTGSFGIGFGVLTVLAASGASYCSRFGNVAHQWPREAALRAGIAPPPKDWRKTMLQVSESSVAAETGCATHCPYCSLQCGMHLQRTEEAGELAVAAARLPDEQGRPLPKRLDVQRNCLHTPSGS